ncbi:hypothetical protein C8R43DRAFT_1115781 [Mycena crocata]|nr:hypothetical protein C8R43DRAFT_1115781 [Mycena crocata]
MDSFPFGHRHLSQFASPCHALFNNLADQHRQHPTRSSSASRFTTVPTRRRNILPPAITMPAARSAVARLFGGSFRVPANRVHAKARFLSHPFPATGIVSSKARSADVHPFQISTFVLDTVFCTSSGGGAKRRFENFVPYPTFRQTTPMHLSINPQSPHTPAARSAAAEISIQPLAFRRMKLRAHVLMLLPSQFLIHFWRSHDRGYAMQCRPAKSDYIFRVPASGVARSWMQIRFFVFPRTGL